MYIFYHRTENTSPENNRKKIEIDETDICAELFPDFLAVSHYEDPSMETFYRDIFKPKVPALIKGNSLIKFISRFFIYFFICLFCPINNLIKLHYIFYFLTSTVNPIFILG